MNLQKKGGGGSKPSAIVVKGGLPAAPVD